MNNFNFCIATEWPDTTQLCVYRVRNTDIHWGDQSHADFLLEYVKQQAPERDWRIIKI